MPLEANNVNCLNSRAIIEYVRRHAPDRVAELLDGLPSTSHEAPLTVAFLCDEDNWIPSGVVVKMFENARRIMGDPEVAFKIGYESITHRDFGYLARLFLKVMSTPRRAVRRINQLNARLNSTKIIELVYDSPGRAVVRWLWREGVHSSKDVCVYNQGIYSALPTLWELPPARITESTCAFEGGTHCDVTITWSLARGRFRNLLSRMFTNKSRLLDALEVIEKDKNLLRKRADELADVNRELNHKLTVLKAINATTRTLVSVPDSQLVLEQSLNPIVEELGFDRALVMLVDKEERWLEYRYGIGESPEVLERLRDYRIPIDREQNLMIRVLRKRRSVLIRDVKAAGLNPTNRILQDFRPSAFAICPLIAENRTIGILGVDRRTAEGRPITAGDMEYLSIFANNIATAFERARLDKELKSSYEVVKSRSEGSVLALVQAIEANDTYTKGHSERVSRLSVAIASRLGWDGATIDLLRFGGILHDVGKIGIAGMELRSPNPLTDTEYRTIQEHPRKGEKILEPIASYLKEHLAVVRSHHERWDGKGYPDGLKGEAIPLGAQIVAVADAFDAMTSDRPYRKGLPAEQAAGEILRCSGTQFAPRVAEAFEKVYQEEILTGKLDLWGH